MSLRLLTSFAIIFGAFTLGFYVAIQGPTLMDLIDLLHVNNDIMSYSLAFASLAYSFGGLMSGFLFNYVNRQILIAIYFAIFGFANIATPFISNYYVFSVITVFKMMCAGGTDCGANVWMLEIWPGKDAWLQALHCSFAVGCALGPLIVEPFLSSEYKNNDKLGTLTTEGHATLNDQVSESRIYIPYGISGSASVFAAIYIVWLYWLEQRQKKAADNRRNRTGSKKLSTCGEEILLKPQHPAILEAGGLLEQTNAMTPLATVENNPNCLPQSQQQQQQQQQQLPPPNIANNSQITTTNNKITSKAKEQSEGRPPYYVMFAVALAALCLSFYCGIEITSMNYLATFAVNLDLQLPKSTAAYMSSALTISFAVGRAFGIWIAAYVKPHKLFYICAGIMATGNVLMLVVANHAEILLWCSICLFGIGCGPMFPAIVSFYDDRISKVTNTVSGIFILGSMFNVALNSLIIGHYIIDNALILIVCNLVGSVLLLVLFGTLHTLTRVKKNQRVKKFKLLQQQKTTTTNINTSTTLAIAPAPATIASATTPTTTTSINSPSSQQSDTPVAIVASQVLPGREDVQ